MAEAVNPWEVDWNAPAAKSEAAPWEQNWEAEKPKEEKKKKPFAYRDEKGVLHIGENLLDLSEDGAAGAAVRAGLSEIPAAGAGAAAFGAAQNTPAVQALQKSGFLPARIAGYGAPLVAGMAGGMTTGLATRAVTKEISPEVALQLEKDAEQHPNAVAAGSVLAQAPFFKPSLGLKVAERAVPAAIGAGVAGAQEVYNGTLDEDGLLRVALAGAGNAVFTNPTGAGNAAMNLGAKIANPITSRLGSVKAGDPLPKVTANTNEIALSGPSEPPSLPVPQPGMESLMGLEKAQGGLPEKAAGSPKATQEKLDTKATIPDPETGTPITVDLAGPLGDFEPTEPFIPKKLTDTEVFNRRVKGVIDNLAKEGVEIDRQTAVKLARTTDRKEFNAARQKLIDSIKPPEIPAEGPLEKAETKAVSEQAPKETAAPAPADVAPATEAAPTASKPVDDYARYQEIQKTWTELIKAGKGDGDSPEIKKLWAENEEIKNRHGGMPPEAPKVTPEAVEGLKTGALDIAERVMKASKDAGLEVPAEITELYSKLKGEAPTPATPEKLPEPAKEVAPEDKSRQQIKEIEQQYRAAIEAVQDIPEYPKLAEMVKAAREQADLAKDLKAHPLDYSPARRAAATRKASKMMDEAKSFADTMGLTVKEFYDIWGAHALGYDKPAKGVSGGKTTSESGSVIDPVTPFLDAAATGVGKVNDAMLNRMAAADVEATNPKAKRPSIFDEFVGRPVEAEEPEATVEFAKPGEGRKPAKKEQAALKEISYEGDLLPTRDSITGERIPEHEAKNAKTIYDRLTKKAKENDSQVLEKADADAIAQAPEHYVPGLTDLASRFPSLGKTETGQAISDFIGTIAKAAKNKLGLSEDNIGDVLPAAKGKVYERDHFIGKLTNRLVEGTEEFGRLARKNLSREEFLKLEMATLSGDEAAILDVFKGKSAGPELEAAYRKNQETKAEARDMLIAAGRDVGQVDAYFQRIVHDREGLLKSFGRDISIYDDAIKKATEAKGAKLTPDEENKVLNSLVLGSLRNEGGPGFLKKRTIADITENILKYYEPFDVADARWSTKVARDIGNRKFFGKIDPDASGIYTEDSSFGKVINAAYKSGELKDRGLRILQENLKDLYRTDRDFNAALEKIGAGVRKAQTFAYLADAGTALVQFADVFSIAREYGIKSAAKGYAGKKLDIGTIGVTEGHNPDMLELSRVPKSKVLKAIDAPYRWSMKNLIGRADEFQKSATVKAATAKIHEEATKPNSDFFRDIEAKYKKMFPDRWDAMKKSIQSDDFAKGKLDENSSLFLFSELSRLQPINASGRAQGYQTAGAWGKAIYALRSYWLKQVGILRNQAYNEIKRGEKGEGARALVTYLTVVAVGQQAFQVVKDKILQRDVAPEDYAIGGLMQLSGIPRYAVYRQKQVGAGTAAAETIIPGLGLLNDLGKDASLAAKGLTGPRDKTGGKSVNSLGSFLEQAESPKYIPAVGREVEGWLGTV